MMVRLIHLLNIFKFKLSNIIIWTHIDPKMSKIVQSTIANNHSSIQTKNKSKDQHKYHHVETQLLNYGSNRQATKGKAEKLGCQDVKKKQISSNADRNKIYEQLISKKNMDHHINKKQVYKAHAVKRPQTPDPVSTEKHEFQNVKYPKPELILKEIEKNVNFLKQMYYASLSQQNSLPQKNSGYQQQKLAHSQSNDKQIGLGSCKDQERNIRKSFDIGSHSKKSVPQISIVPTFQPYSTQNTKNFNSKIYQQFIGTSELKNDKLTNNGKQKQQLKQKKKSKQKSKSGQLKQKENERRKSTSNLQKGKLKKNIKQSCNNQEQISNKNPSTNYCSPTFQNVTGKNGQKGANINSLFEIFKYYKRSIDSSLSKRTSASHVQVGNENYQKSAQNRTVNVYISNSNKNQSNNKERSYGKQTPNNSTTKNTTNHKDSTISRNYGSSIDPSIQVSIQEKQDHENENIIKEQNKKLDRKSSKSNSAKKNKSKKTSLQSKESVGKKKNEGKGTIQVKTKVKKNRIPCNIFRQDGKETCRNYVSELQSKKIKQDDKKKKKEVKQRQRQPSLKTGDTLEKAFKKKGDKKTSALNQNNLVTTSFNSKTKNHNYQYHQEEDHRIEFPQIQSSLFDRNMPILEQDSREEASSEFLAVTGQKNQQQEILNRSAKQENEANESQKKATYWIQNKQNNLNLCNTLQRHQVCNNIQNIHEEQMPMRIYTREQTKRIHTPPYPAFEAQNNSKQPEISVGLDVEKGKQEKSKQTKKSDDSLAGFEIPKRDSDSDLDNFELVSFEL